MPIAISINKTDTTQDNEFETQFARREYLDTLFGKIETVDLIPPKLNHQTPILLAPGWGETLYTQKAVIKELYMSGRRVLAFRHAVLIQKRKNKTDFPHAELQKAETLLAFLHHKKIKKVDVVSHSEGAINVAIAATCNPKLFNNLILVAPAGVSGKDIPVRIIFGFLHHAFITRKYASHLISNIQKPTFQKEGTLLKRLASVNHEVNAMATYDIYPLLIKLRKRGVKVVILAGEEDVVFPLKKMKQHLTSSLTKYNILEKENYGLTLFTTKKDGHGLHSNPKIVTQQVLSLLTRLENE